MGRIADKYAVRTPHANAAQLGWTEEQYLIYENADLIHEVEILERALENMIKGSPRNLGNIVFVPGIGEVVRWKGVKDITQELIDKQFDELYKEAEEQLKEEEMEMV